jgi:hypothetical protein
MIALMKTAESCQTLAPSFVSDVLSPYFDHTTYLKEVAVSLRPKKDAGFDAPLDISARGVFRIEKSCYIQSTGHFNAVEFNICFNQLAYVMYAHGFVTGYFPERYSESGDRLRVLNAENFANKQLSSMLIVNLASKFKKEIRGKQFYGELEIGKVRATPNCMFSTNHVKFFDDDGGFSEGEVTLALLLPQNA